MGLLGRHTGRWHVIKVSMAELWGRLGATRVVETIRSGLLQDQDCLAGISLIPPG